MVGILAKYCPKSVKNGVKTGENVRKSVKLVSFAKRFLNSDSLVSALGKLFKMYSFKNHEARGGSKGCHNDDLSFFF